MIIIPKGNKSVNIMIPKGYSDNINIPDVSKVEIRELNITENGEYIIEPEDGYYALSKVIIKVNV